MSTNFVLDSSLALSWCFDDEATDSVQEILETFGEGARAFVPPLWAWEINNTLTMAQRTKRLTPAERIEKSSLLQALPIEVDEIAHKQCWTATSTVAHEQKLSVYDAAYLEMAIRLNVPLGSLDSDLRAAAKKVGVKLLPSKV